jgi:ribonuclease HI
MNYGVHRGVDSRVEVKICWSFPPHYYFCLNTDGAARIENLQSGCGGVIRDGRGKWVCGFAKALGPSNAFVAELWGVLEGLSIAKAHNINKLEVQIDSTVVLQCLTSSKECRIRGRRLVQRIRGLIGEDMEVQFKHVYREANKVADYLANLGCNLVNGITLFDVPPREVQQLVDDDVLGVSTSRMIIV